MSVQERVAVAEVLIEGRDFLANAIQYWQEQQNGLENMIQKRDWKMVQALTQAADLLLDGA